MYIILLWYVLHYYIMLLYYFLLGAGAHVKVTSAGDSHYLDCRVINVLKMT